MHSDLTVNGQTATNAAAWAQLLATLHEHDVEMINPHEVAWCSEEGMPLIDIRTEPQFAEGFIEGAINVPLFQPIQKWDAFNVLRRVGCGSSCFTPSHTLLGTYTAAVV
jgi:hypothetical protein